MAFSYSLVQLWVCVYVCVPEQDLNFASVVKETFHTWYVSKYINLLFALATDKADSYMEEGNKLYLIS